MNDGDSDSGFLSRWSRRKVQARDGVAPMEPATRAARPCGDAGAGAGAAGGRCACAAVGGRHCAAAEAVAPAPAPPTLDDVATLTRESDFSRFVAPGVDGDVKNAALKKLFSDPHFNVMDGLDIYIDDYSKPDPLPAVDGAQDGAGGVSRPVRTRDRRAAIAAGEPAPTPHGSGAEVRRGRRVTEAACRDP